MDELLKQLEWIERSLAKGGSILITQSQGEWRIVAAPYGDVATASAGSLTEAFEQAMDDLPKLVD